MALELKYASDATVLLTDLVDSLGRPSSPAGVVVPVLMPSLPLVDRTKAELARRHGVAMGVEFLLPGSFIERMARLVGLDPVHPSWRPQGLAWRLVPLLAAMVEEGHTPRLESACMDARARRIPLITLVPLSGTQKRTCSSTRAKLSLPVPLGLMTAVTMCRRYPGNRSSSKTSR